MHQHVVKVGVDQPHAEGALLNVSKDASIVFAQPPQNVQAFVSNDLSSLPTSLMSSCYIETQTTMPYMNESQ
jgi:hypothetical protein